MPKQFVGSGWERTFENGGTVINLSVSLDAIRNLPVDEYGNVRLVVSGRKKPDEKSKATHYVAVDEYYYQHPRKPSGPKTVKGDLPF